MKHLTDHQLIERYLKGDQASLEFLIARYMGPLYGFLQKYLQDPQTTEDVLQEVFLKLWRNIKKIDNQKNFKSWLYTVAKNTALDYLKKKKAIPFSRFETDEGKNVLVDVLADAGASPHKASEARELSTTFAGAIKKLSGKYATVLKLYYYQYLNFREIAQQLGEPINTIKSRHRRGLVMLKQSIAGSI